MNKTVIFVTFAILAALGIGGSVLLYILSPNTASSFVGNLITILGIVTVAAGTFAALGRTNEKLTKVEKQTNGTLSRLLEQKESDTQAIKTLSEQKAALEAALRHPSRKVRDYE